MDENKKNETATEKKESDLSTILEKEHQEFKRIITEFHLRNNKISQRKKLIHYCIIPLICLLLIGAGSTVIAHTTYSGDASSLTVCLLSILMLIYALVMVIKVSSLEKGNIENVIKLMETDQYLQLSNEDKKLLKALI